MKTKEEIHTLQDLLSSKEYEKSRFGSSSDDMINDTGRYRRCIKASENGGDGSTHAEYIQDWRDCLDRLDLSEEINTKIRYEIDACEAWHEANGSLDEMCG